MEKYTSFNQKKLLVDGTVILVLAAIITKLLSALYRIPFQNIVGDVGFYIYQQIYPFFGIAIALATAGFPVIISKFYAEIRGSKFPEQDRNFLINALLGIFVFCLGLFLLLFLGANPLARKMGDLELAPLIRIIAFSFLLIPFTSILRGYFQGQENMKPTAISQVGEQSVRVILILVFSVILVMNDYSLYRVGESAMLASILGSFFGVCLLAQFFIRGRKASARPREKFSLSMPIVRAVIIQGIAVCISGLTLVLFQLSDAFQIYSLLIEQGVPEETAKVYKGIFDRGQPIIQFGLILAGSLSLSIVPIITSVKNKEKELLDYTQLAIKTAIIVGAGAAVGLMLIIEPLNIMLFENGLGSEVLRVLSGAVFFGSITAAVIAILQGVGHTFYPAFIVIIGVIIKGVLNAIWIPAIGIAGAALATNMALIIMLILLRRKIRKIVGSRILHKGFFGHLLYSLGLMAMAIFALFMIFEFLIQDSSRIVASFQALFITGIGAFIYVFYLVRSGVFTKDELQLLPLGTKLQTFLKKETRGE